MKATLQSQFAALRDQHLKLMATELQAHIEELLHDEGVARIDRVSARAKEVDSFVRKSEKENEDGTPKYSNPLVQIQDQIGARVTVFYQSDVDMVSEVLVLKYFRSIEHVDKIPETDWEFGYFGKHFILALPSDVLPDGYEDVDSLPQFFELQIKTLFQHAWSEANHDLGYKKLEGKEPEQMKRRLAFASAQAWGADRIFEELHSEIES